MSDDFVSYLFITLLSIEVKKSKYYYKNKMNLEREIGQTERKKERKKRRSLSIIIKTK